MSTAKTDPKKATAKGKKETVKKVINNTISFDGIEKSKHDQSFYERDHANISSDTSGSLENGLKSLLNLKFNQFEQIDFLISKESSKIIKLPLLKPLNKKSFPILKNALCWYFSGSWDSWKYNYNLNFSIEDLKDKQFCFSKSKKVKNGSDIVKQNQNNEFCIYNIATQTIYITHTSKYFSNEFLLLLLENENF